PVTITWPGEPGRAERTQTVEAAYFDENPAPQTIAATGIKGALNGILYIRESQAPDDLTRSFYDASIPVGYRFSVRGRQYRVVKADLARGEYRFMLSDLHEADYG